jgi:23S rRNA pseudouridine2605 synthase
VDLDSRRQSPNSVRLQKYLAQCGVASRRAGEEWIRQGRVAVDGRIITEVGVSVDPSTQTVSVDGRVIQPESFLYILLNKPRNTLCTSRDPQGRLTYQELLPDLPGRVFSVGRLDMDSEGLLLLTNDGDLANRLAHPRHHVDKTYLVWISAPLNAAAMAVMTGDGVDSEGERLRMKAITPKGQTRGGWLYEVVLGEGKKRQIRRMIAWAGPKVLRLQRVSMGTLQLGSLKTGAWRYMSRAEVEQLRKASAAPVARVV